MIDTTEIAWAAGLWEGEGSFYVRRCVTGGHTYVYAAASLSMIDRDVLVRLRDVLGRGRIKERKDKTARNPERSVQYQLSIDAQDEVFEVMATLESWLGARRRAQIALVRERAIGRDDAATTPSSRGRGQFVRRHNRFATKGLGS